MLIKWSNKTWFYSSHHFVSYSVCGARATIASSHSMSDKQTLHSPVIFDREWFNHHWNGCLYSYLIPRCRYEVTYFCIQWPGVIPNQPWFLLMVWCEIWLVCGTGTTIKPPYTLSDMQTLHFHVMSERRLLQSSLELLSIYLSHSLMQVWGHTLLYSVARNPDFLWWSSVKSGSAVVQVPLLLPPYTHTHTHPIWHANPTFACDIWERLPKSSLEEMFIYSSILILMRAISDAGVRSNSSTFSALE